MTATTPSTALVSIQSTFADSERLALASRLARYRGLTEPYTLDLRQFTGWCRARSLPLFSVRRGDVEIFARELEARGRARATVIRRLCTIAGFCKYAVENLLDHSPAAHVRVPAWITNPMQRHWTATSPGLAWQATARRSTWPSLLLPSPRAAPG
jgi:integrase/recombinase XerD